MMLISCEELGVSCDYEAKAPTVQELVPLVEKHGREYHGMTELPPEIGFQIRDQARNDGRVRES